MSAAFCASASGKKLPVLIVVPRLTDLPNYTPPENVVVHYKASATFDDVVIKNQFLDRVFIPHVQRKNIRSDLFLDNATCHKTTTVYDVAKQNGINIRHIPPRLTSILQPADVCWFSAIKSKLSDCWTSWYLSEDTHSFTKAENLKSPGYALVIDWISKIWAEFDESILRDSFDACGISSNSNLSSMLKCIVSADSDNEISNDYVTDAEDADCSVQFTQRSLFDEGPTTKTCPAVNASTQENLNFDVTKPIICEKCAACFSKRCTRWSCCPKCKSWFCGKCQKNSSTCC
jgi:hypothetical protein